MALPLFILAVLLSLLFSPTIALSQQWPFGLTLDWQWPEWQQLLLYTVALTFIAMALNNLNNNFELNGRRNSFAGVYFILMASMAGFSIKSYWHLLVLFLFLGMLYFCFSIFRRLKKNSLLFNIGFITGLILVLDLHWLPIIVFSFIAVSSLNFLRFNEFLLFLISIALPAFYKYLYLSVIDTAPQSFDWLGNASYAFPWPQSYIEWVSWGVLAFIYLAQFTQLPQLISSLRIGPKKYLWVVLYLLGFFTIIIFLYPDIRPQLLLYTGMPLAMLMSSRVSHSRDKNADLFWFYLLLLIFVLISILKALPLATFDL